MSEQRKISPAPNWTSVFTMRDDLAPPGYVEAFLEAHDTTQHYGWGVLTTRGIGVIKVFDWEEAKRIEPFQWLNAHPKQPAPVQETLELVKETLKKMRKKQNEQREKF